MVRVSVLVRGFSVQELSSWFSAQRGRVMLPYVHQSKRHHKPKGLDTSVHKSSELIQLEELFCRYRTRETNSAFVSYGWMKLIHGYDSLKCTFCQFDLAQDQFKISLCSGAV